MKKLLDTLKAIDTKIFGKHRVLGNVILGACLAAVVVVIAVNVIINHDEAAKAQGTYIEDSVKDNKKSDGSYIIKGEISEKDGVTTIVTDDGTYIIKDGCLYKLGADGKEEKLSSDLSKVIVYDKTGNKNIVVDGKLVEEKKTEEETTTPSAAPAEQTVGEAIVAPEEQQVDIGEDVGVTQPQQTDLPWIYPYPTQTGYYKNSENGWIRGVEQGDNAGMTAEQVAKMDELSWKVCTYQITDDEFEEQVAKLFGRSELAPGLWDVWYIFSEGIASSTNANAQEKIATQGYVPAYIGSTSDRYVEGYTYHVNYYDAATDHLITNSVIFHV